MTTVVLQVVYRHHQMFETQDLVLPEPADLALVFHQCQQLIWSL